MRAVRLRVDYLKEPMGLGNLSPRFYWNAEGGEKQSAYRILCRRDGRDVWDSGKTESDSMTQIRYEGEALRSRDRVEWSVQLWDESGEPGEIAESTFEMGLLSEEEWKASWICGDYRAKRGKRYQVDCFRKEVTVRKTVRRARVYASARGIYDFSVDGTPVRDFVFAPGMTDYRKRIQVQTYDVTSHFETPGSHVWDLRLADGWFRGSSAAYGVTNVYGTTTSLIAQLELWYEDGSREVIGTDESFCWSNDGPIRFADLKDGEIYDAGRVPSFSGRARIDRTKRTGRLLPSDNVPVREQEHFSAKVLYRSDHRMLLDFGQNLAGILRFRVTGPRGLRLRLICGETTGEKGRVDLSGIQERKPADGWTQTRLIRKLLGLELKGKTDVTPRQEIQFTASGEEDFYRTSFAVFGFRYVQVDVESGSELPVDQVLPPERIEAVAVYSDLEETGRFSCSNPLVNRLLENTRWSMKSNFLDLPTDCPTRERLGWTGDAQVFFDTGAYLADTAPFFAKWLRDMEDAQYKNGLIPAVLPYQGVEMMYKATGSSVGWADAVYLIPWRYYQRYGDRQILEKYWPMMVRYGEYLEGHLGMRDRKEGKKNPLNRYTYEKGVHLGEWLEPERFRDTVYGTKAKHPEECTAYLFLAMKTLADIAEILGEREEEARFRRIADGAVQAYRHLRRTMDPLDTDRQAKLVRPLALGLLSGEERKAAAERLVLAAEHYDWCVGTGFLSTPFLLGALAENGYPDAAYRMLENEKAPGWLAEVKAGATTIWENWEGDLSLNHYSPGAVCAWLFDTVCGIRQDGENRFVIAPCPGGSLTFAEASYRSLYGEVFVRWDRTEEMGRDVYKIQIRVPANTSASVILPDGRAQECTAGSWHFSCFVKTGLEPADLSCRIEVS